MEPVKAKIVFQIPANEYVIRHGKLIYDNISFDLCGVMPAEDTPVTLSLEVTLAETL